MPARERLTPDRLSAAYERDAKRLLVWLTRRTYDAQLATDLVGETFARAFAARARFTGADDDELSAWLFGIARNALHEALRKGEAERRAMRRLGVERVVLTDNELLRIEDLAEPGTLRAALVVWTKDGAPRVVPVTWALTMLERHRRCVALNERQRPLRVTSGG